jgi:hypothetical protein
VFAENLFCCALSLPRAAGIYAGTLALSVFAYVYNDQKKKKRQALAAFGRGEGSALNASRPDSYGTSPLDHEPTEATRF